MTQSLNCCIYNVIQPSLASDVESILYFAGAIALSDAANGYEMALNGSDFGGCWKEQTMEDKV